MVVLVVVFRRLLPVCAGNLCPWSKYWKNFSPCGQPDKRKNTLCCRLWLFFRLMKMVHTYWNIFDPDTGSITNHTVNEDIFCMGQAVLPNGKVLCAGGTLRYDAGDPDGTCGKAFPLRLNMILVQTH